MARRTCLLALLLAVLLASAGVWAPEGAHAAPLRIDRLIASPAQAAADGGRITIRVAVSDVAPGGETVTLATTRGAFGAAAGPTRIVLRVAAGADGAGVATAVLVGNGSVGRATVTASALLASRRVTVRFIGEPAILAFSGPAAGAQSVREAHPVTLRAYDAAGVAVPGAAIVLSTNRGRLVAAAERGTTVTLTTDGVGRASAMLEPPLGAVRLQAVAGSARATLELRLVGPPASLELEILQPIIHLHDFPEVQVVPPHALELVVRDEIGQPVAGVPVTFAVDAPGLTVVPSALDGASRTGADGAVRAHLSAGEGVQPGVVTVTARAASLEDRGEVRVAGPPASIVVSLSEIGAADFALRAVVRDAAGQPVLPVAPGVGYEVTWRALNVPAGGGVTFTPPRSPLEDGTAASVATVATDPPASVTVQAYVVGSNPLVAAAVVLPTPLPTSGTLLQAGLNALVWTGPHSYISTVVAPLKRVVVGVWRLDQGAGWQAYFPNVGVGQDYLIAHGDRFWVRVDRAVLMPNVELAGE